MSELLNRIDLRFDFVSEKLALHTITPGGCWEYQGNKRADGYGYITLSIKELSPRKRKYRMHRISYAFHNGVDPKDLLVCHRCDNPACINPDHLFLGTGLDNTQDMIAKGRKADSRGEKNPQALITEKTVIEILSQIRCGKTNKQIAEGLPVSHSQVSLIRLGKSWRRVTQAAGYNPSEHRMFTRARAGSG